MNCTYCDEGWVWTWDYWQDDYITDTCPCCFGDWRNCSDCSEIALDRFLDLVYNANVGNHLLKKRGLWRIIE